VRSARANPLTSNVLVQFDPAATDHHMILSRLQSLVSDVMSAKDEPAPPPALHERTGTRARARIAVRGLDRDPSLAGEIVKRLSGLPGVTRVGASPLTGRVLVEYELHSTEIDDLLAHVASVELPDLPDEDRPAHPLDPGPLIQSSARTVGSALGLGVLSAQQLAGLQINQGLRANALRVGSGIGILYGFPFIRNGLRRLFGRNVADVMIFAPMAVSLTLAGSPLGLAVTGLESLRLLTEVVARRGAWRRYEERLETAPSAHPGAVIRLESGELTPLAAEVIEGTGTSIGPDGLPAPAAPGHIVSAGARLYGGPFALRLQSHEPFRPRPRSYEGGTSLYRRYLRTTGLASLAYAALTALFTRSLSRTFQAFLLVNPRTAIIGTEAADTGAAARVLRAGAVIVGTRPDRRIRLPNSLLLEAPRLLTDGLEVSTVLPLAKNHDTAEILARAAGIAAAAGSPWGGALPAPGDLQAADGSFDGTTAAASIAGTRYTLGPMTDRDAVPAALRLRSRGEYPLILRSERRDRPLGMITVRPRLAPGVRDLVDECRRHGVEIALLSAGDPVAAQVIARRANLPLLPENDAVEAIRVRQEADGMVAFVADSIHGGRAFAAADLAIGLTTGRSSHFPARADLLAPDLVAVAAVVEAGARREAASRDSVALSIVGNLAGAIWGWSGEVGLARASYAFYITALAAVADQWARLRGGDRPRSSVARLVDPRPERWGRRGVENVLSALRTTERGLTHEEAARRRQADRPVTQRNVLADAVLTQIRSPLTAVLAAGAGLAIVLGSVADVFMIGATIMANIAVGVWQERQAGQAIAALERIGTARANVLRDGQPVTVPATNVVPGDVLVLSPGVRVAADARIISAQGLEIDEAALTGESLPVVKMASGGTDASRIVMAGSDVTVGTGLGVVVAVGRRTRMGATAAALALDETVASPLGVRLNRMLRQVLPLAGIGGLIVLASGIVRGQPLLAQLAIGASIAIAAVPEGLPLLAGVGEAAVARRLAGHQALVRRLSAVEALGRVDVACTDKTGTLTEGRLALSLVASIDEQAEPTTKLPGNLHNVLLVAGLATPHPDAPDASAHPTDIAVVQGARAAGIEEELRVEREAEVPFDPVRSFHAALARGHLSVKGATEELVPRCDWVQSGGDRHALDDSGRQALYDRAQGLAERGLRVLMVAEGAPTAPPDDPRGLTALGFIGISDPLRADVGAAVRRCHDAGVRVVMLTGDHPATARAIALEAGLLRDGDGVLTGDDIAELEDGDLDRRLERTTVVARVTPLDKVRIVESLQRSGHTVAMTGDGVNDGPALRLADVGVAMGRGGTEVARQAADVVLSDDDFSTLVEGLGEGRSFWRNIRRALGLLLGGNLGELGLVVGASVLGLASPLITRQILAVNMVADVLPSLAVAVQSPEHRTLAGLARERAAALDDRLRRDVLRRGTATAAPALAAFIITLRSTGLAEARSVAFASIVATQLAQTLDAGRTEETLTRSVLGAVAGSTGLLLATLTVPPLRTFLGLVTPSPLGWSLIGAGALAAILLGRGLSAPALNGRPLHLRPSPSIRSLPAPSQP